MDAMERGTSARKNDQPEPSFDPNWEWRPDWESDQDPEPISSWGEEFDDESGAEPDDAWEYEQPEETGGERPRYRDAERENDPAERRNGDWDPDLDVRREYGSGARPRSRRAKRGGRRTGKTRTTERHGREKPDWEEEPEERKSPFRKFVDQCKQKLEWEDDPEETYEPSRRSGGSVPASSGTRRNSGSPKQGQRTAKAAARQRGHRTARVAASILRHVSAVLMIFVSAQMAAVFFSGYRELGSIKQLVEERNVGLAIYLGAACLLVGFGILSVFWTLSRRKMADGDGIRHFDTGRGSFAFLCFGALSLCAGLGSLLPDGGSALQGAKSFLLSVSTPRGTVLPLCIAGFVACLARKFLRG